MFLQSEFGEVLADHQRLDFGGEVTKKCRGIGFGNRGFATSKPSGPIEIEPPHREIGVAIPLLGRTQRELQSAKGRVSAF